MYISASAPNLRPKMQSVSPNTHWKTACECLLAVFVAFIQRTGCQSQVFSLVVETVAITVVHFKESRRIKNNSVHWNMTRAGTVGFSSPSFGIRVSPVIQMDVPPPLIQPLIIFGVHNRNLSLRQRYLATHDFSSGAGASPRRARRATSASAKELPHFGPCGYVVLLRHPGRVLRLSAYFVVVIIVQPLVRPAPVIPATVLPKSRAAGRISTGVGQLHSPRPRAGHLRPARL